jgi:hypothetical protein
MPKVGLTDDEYAAVTALPSGADGREPQKGA